MFKHPDLPDAGISRASLADYVGPDEMHQGFFFDLLDSPYDGEQFARVIDAGLRSAAARDSTVTWVLGNHDQTLSTTADTWLPQPPSFAVHTADVRRHDPHSAWRLYQTGLQLRRKHLAESQSLEWLPSPAGVVAFTRGDGFASIANLTDRPVPSVSPAAHLLSSGPTTAGSVPPDTTVWWVA